MLTQIKKIKHPLQQWHYKDHTTYTDIITYHQQIPHMADSHLFDTRTLSEYLAISGMIAKKTRGEYYHSQNRLFYEMTHNAPGRVILGSKLFFHKIQVLMGSPSHGADKVQAHKD